MKLLLEDVTFSYNGAGGPSEPALVGVSFGIEPGELVLILGSTGSGKSTLLRIGAGVLAPETGRVTMDGSPLRGVGLSAGVGLVFQEPESQLFADTLIQDVAFGPRNLGASPEDAARRAEAALGAVGLDPAVYAERSPFSLSGGEARRAAVAGVLAGQPRFLLADEPTAGLDAPGRHAVRSALLQARERAGVVVVTHTAEEFLGDADRVVVLERGRCVMDSSAGELIAAPERLTDAGLRPPAVLEAQLLAARRFDARMEYSLDTRVAASALASLRGRG